MSWRFIQCFGRSLPLEFVHLGWESTSFRENITQEIVCLNKGKGIYEKNGNRFEGANVGALEAEGMQ